MNVKEAVATRAGNALGLEPAYVKRFVGYGAVGATGIVVDLTTVQTMRVLGFHWLIAVGVAYIAAMTWNFALQRWLVWNATGSVVRQYLRYVAVDVATFGARVSVVYATLEVTEPWDAMPYVPAPIDPAVPASLFGILVAVVIGYSATEWLVFGEVQS